MDQDFSQQPTLTGRELDVLRLLALGLRDREIAETLILSVGTIKWYNRQIYNKLGVSNRTEAVAKARRRGILADTGQAQPLSQNRESAQQDLPAQITSFIGRKHELTELKNLLKTARLITLTGPPGAGKTRLALQAGMEVKAHYHDGVCFVPLASLRDPEHIVQSIASVLGMGESGQDSLLVSLKNHLKEKHLLLLLDNFEHLLAAAPLVTELLAVAPRLYIVVTSREALRLYGEQEFPVLPLTTPDLKAPAAVDVIKAYDAVELFVQRAQAVLPTFALNDDNAPAVASICTHLDGLPLAIELAAARIRLYAPQMLLIRLSSRLEALNEGPRDLPSRQRTLRATLAWSYELLDGNEKILFARLGVFAGSWTLADAQAVCGDDVIRDVGAGIESLLTKSMIQPIQTSGNIPRFMLLETMREYALELLEIGDEKTFVYEQFIQHYLSVAEKAAEKVHGPDGAGWFQRLEWQHANLRAALRRCVDTGEAVTSLRFVGSLARFWEIRGYLSEGLAWLASALDLQGAQKPSLARANALNGGGDLAYLQSNYELSGRYYRDAYAIYEEIGDLKGTAHALVGLGEVATEVGDYETAPELFQQAYAIMQSLDDTYGCARASTQLGWGAMRVGNFDQAREWLEAGLTLYQLVDDKVGISLTLSGLGEIAIRTHEFELAKKWLAQSLHLRRELGEKWGTAASLGSLAWVAIRQNDLGQAVQLLQESLLIRLDISDKGGIAWCLEKMGEIAYLKHETRRAARTFGAAHALRKSIDSVIDPSDQQDYFALLDRLRSELGDGLFNALWNEGQRMQPEQAIQRAFNNDERT